MGVPIVSKQSLQTTPKTMNKLLFLLAAVIAVQQAYVLDSTYNPDQRLQTILDGLAGFDNEPFVKRSDGMLAPAMMSRHFSLLSRYGGAQGGHFDGGRMNGFGKRK